MLGQYCNSLIFSLAFFTLKLDAIRRVTEKKRCKLSRKPWRRRKTTFQILSAFVDGFTKISLLNQTTQTKTVCRTQLFGIEKALKFSLMNMPELI